MRSLLLSLPLAASALVACGAAGSAPTAGDRASAARDNNKGVSLAHEGKDREAAALFASACYGGSSEGCFNFRAVLQLRDVRVSMDTARAAALFTKTYDGGDSQLCVEVGTMFKDGVGVAEDDAHAMALFTRACDAGAPEGCYNLGIMFEYGVGVPKDPTRAATLLTRACGGGNNAACVGLKMLRESSQ